MCAIRKYIGRRGTRSRYPQALSQGRYQWAIQAYRPLYTLLGTPEMPCKNPTDALAVHARYTLNFTAPGRVSFGIPSGTGRAPVTFSENEDKSPLIAGRAPTGPRQDSGRVSVKHDLIMTTVPGARQGLRSRPCSQPGRGPGQLWP